MEEANGIIFTSIKKNITDLPSSRWAEELPRVIWSHNTSVSRATNFSPFRLLYSEEAMMPEEIKLGSLRTEANPEGKDMEPTIDTAQELRTQAIVNSEAYQDETRRWKNKKIQPRGIQTGDLVLRKIPNNRKYQTATR